MPEASDTLANNLTVIVPAYNEENSIRDTLLSLQRQTTPPKHIIVVDDCSTDQTTDVARSMGVKVLCPPQNTGSKAGAQNYALQHVTTPYTMALDADTTLAPNALEKLLPALTEPQVAAVCGSVTPRYVQTVWERGRYIEYLLAFTFYKPIQEYFDKPLISSGCFSAYKTDILKKLGGWSERTRAEDMDLTWSFYEQGYQVRFVDDAVCFPIEPHDISFMQKQLKRWSHGFVQNIKLHWKGILHIHYLSTVVGVALWDATVASIIYLILLPVFAIVLQKPIFFLGYVIDAPAIIVPALYTAWKRKELWRAVSSLPAFFVLRTVNALYLLEALWTEVVLRKPLLVYEKGH